MISDRLIPRLRDRFPKRPGTFGVPPAPAAVFRAAHPEVGDVQVFDDGGAVLLIVGHFTHSHIADYTPAANEVAEENIVGDVIAFLERLFADEIVMWGSHKDGGGWYARDRAEGSGIVRPTGPLYVWSGPLGG